MMDPNYDHSPMAIVAPGYGKPKPQQHQYNVTLTD